MYFTILLLTCGAVAIFLKKCFFCVCVYVTGGSPGEDHFGVPAGDSAACGFSLTEVCFLLSQSSTTIPTRIHSNSKRVHQQDNQELLLLCDLFNIKPLLFQHTF